MARFTSGIRAELLSWWRGGPVGILDGVKIRDDRYTATEPVVRLFKAKVLHATYRVYIYIILFIFMLPYMFRTR